MLTKIRSEEFKMRGGGVQGLLEFFNNKKHSYIGWQLSLTLSPANPLNWLLLGSHQFNLHWNRSWILLRIHVVVMIMMRLGWGDQANPGFWELLFWQSLPNSGHLLINLGFLGSLRSPLLLIRRVKLWSKSSLIKRINMIEFLFMKGPIETFSCRGKYVG